jgi:hypothetical protein
VSVAAIGVDRILSQDGFSVRLDWALAGARALAPRVDLLVIVDVLSFTTAVEVAVGVVRESTRFHIAISRPPPSPSGGRRF